MSCRKIEGRHRTDEYKHHNLGTNFDIFIAVSSKSLRSLKSTFYRLSNHYITERFVLTNAIEKQMQEPQYSDIIISCRKIESRD